MADQDLPEIQPTGSGRGKQVVFLFMSAVVVLVVVFLLGVSVGRGVRPLNVASATSAVDPADSSAPAATPPAAPGDLNYHESLRGAAPTDASKAGPAATPPPTPEPSPNVAPPPSHDAPAPVKEPAKPAAATATSGTAPAAGKYSVQVGLFSTKAAAESMVSRVRAKDKSYAAATITLPATAPGPRFRVMVGPFSTRDEADRTLGRLKKDGFTTAFVR